MASDDQFYREYILDHYKNPRNFGRIEAPDISHEEYNPLCGDMVGMDFRLREGVIEDVMFHGRGCAISQASASLMTERLKGMTVEEAREVSKDDVLEELGIEISPARLKCALLSLKVLKVGAYGLAADEEDDYEVLRECYDPEIPVNIVDLGLVYEVDIKPARVDVKMTLTALGCPMAGEVMTDVRDHLLQLPGVEEAGVELVYEPPWTPERMTEDARWELGMV